MLPTKEKKPGMAIMVAIGKSKGAPPELDSPRRSGMMSSANHMQEQSGEEERYHEQGEPPAPTPESVNYHTAAEACGNCEYFREGNCDFLRMPVNEGDWCRRFEDRHEDQERSAPAGQPEAATGEPQEVA